MHLLLTDRLSCPRCGPTFGLILRADRIVERLVLDGVLGCPNCRDAFGVVAGFADLRAPPRDELGPGLAGPPPDPDAPADERAARVVALLGIAAGPGTIALVGEPARLGAEVSAGLPEAHVVGVDPDLRFWPETSAMSRIAAGPGLPFFGSTLRGIAVDGRLGPAWVAEAARVVHRKARVVVLHAPEETRAVLAEGGLSVLAAEAETVVAARG